MLDREAVAARLAGPGISYAEFSYQLLQAEDYLELFRNYSCSLQTGGSDQWGTSSPGWIWSEGSRGAQVSALTTFVFKADGTKSERRRSHRLA